MRTPPILNPSAILLLIYAGSVHARNGPPGVIDAAAFNELAAQCAPSAPLATLRSIVAAESEFHPYAVSIHDADDAIALARQPNSASEAVRWTKWLVSNGQTVSIGLMQLNVEHLAALKLPLEKAFDPCTNLRIGWRIFNDKYSQAAAVLGKGQLAMQAAFGAYNSGHVLGGFVRDRRGERIAEQPPAEEVPAMESEPEPPPRKIGETPEQKSGRMFETFQTDIVKVEANPGDTRIGWDVNKATAPWVARKDER